MQTVQHISVGAIINRGNKYLLIDRKKFPFGFACLAGHVDEDETPAQALAREIREESNLNLVDKELLIHEFIDWNECSRGVKGHDWYVFNCQVEGKVEQNKAEERSIGWYTIGQIKKLNLESVWKYWFEKLGIL